MEAKTGVIVGITLAAVAGLGVCVNIALNKPTYIRPDTNTWGNEQTNDGNSGTSGSFHYWIVVDLTREYMINEVVVDYNTVGSGNVYAEMYLANPVALETREQVCAVQPQGQTNVRHTMRLVCPTPLRARYVLLRKRPIKIHPAFFCFEIRIEGKLADDCSRTTTKMAKISGSRIVTSYPMNETAGINSVDCAAQCFRKPGCQGINYNHSTMACVMLMLLDIVDVIVPDADWELNYFIL